MRLIRLIRKMPAAFIALAGFFMVMPACIFAAQAVLLVSLGMPDATLKAYFQQAKRYDIPLVIRGLYPENAGKKAYAIQEAAKLQVTGEATKQNKRKKRKKQTRLTSAVTPSLPRGVLRSGDFIATANRLKHLMLTHHQGGVMINPLWFRAFEVKAVPALVIYDKHLPCLQGGQPQAANTKVKRACAKTDYDLVTGNLPLSRLLSRIADSAEARYSAYAHTLLSKYHKKATGVSKSPAKLVSKISGRREMNSVRKVGVS